MISIDSTGRLSVLRFEPPLDVIQADALSKSVKEVFERLKGAAVFCTDMRTVPVLPPAVSERILMMLKSDNPRIEKSAVLIGSSSVLGLQVERLFREAGNPGRRGFRTAQELCDWVGPALDNSEQARLRSFFA